MSTALAVQTPDQWVMLREQATEILKSGYLPAHIKTPQQAVTIALVGQELGISPWRALTGITVIQGKPTLAAELMLSLIYEHAGPDAIVFKESTDKLCTVTYRRKGSAHIGEYTYTIEMAKRAGLLSNPTWTKHTENMLRARCVSNVARMAFPDIIAGVYSEDEGEEIAQEAQVTEVKQVRVLVPLASTTPKTVAAAVTSTTAPTAVIGDPPTAEQLYLINLNARIVEAFFNRQPNPTPASSFEEANERLTGAETFFAKARLRTPGVPVSPAHINLLDELAAALEERHYAIDAYPSLEECTQQDAFDTVRAWAEVLENMMTGEIEPAQETSDQQSGDEDPLIAGLPL